MFLIGGSPDSMWLSSQATISAELWRTCGFSILWLKGEVELPGVRPAGIGLVAEKPSQVSPESVGVSGGGVGDVVGGGVGVCGPPPRETKGERATGSGDAVELEMRGGELFAGKELTPWCGTLRAVHLVWPRRCT